MTVRSLLTMIPPCGLLRITASSCYILLIIRWEFLQQINQHHCKTGSGMNNNESTTPELKKHFTSKKITLAMEVSYAMLLFPGIFP